MPLVITSECTVMEPIKFTNQHTHSVFELMETDSTVTEDSDRNGKGSINDDDEKMFDSLEVAATNLEESSKSDNSNRHVNKMKVLNIFLNRNVGFRQSTGSANIDDNSTPTETMSRSMSCGELVNKMDDDSNMENGEPENMEEEGDLLEQLGFKEELKNGRTSSSFLELCGKKKELSYEEMCKRQVQDMFYGNRTYEVITSNVADSSRRNVMGNVMSTVDESVKSYHPFKKVQNLTRQDAEIGGNMAISSLQNNMVDNEERLTGYTMSPQNICDGKCNDKNNNESDQTICGNVIMLRFPLPLGDDGNPIAPCMEGAVIENTGKELIIPRYSAMPRTVSMLVNTSSADYSSDSELSVADSLEEGDSSGHANSTEQSWTNKHDNKMVRGDVMSLLPEENKRIKRQHSTEAYAYFVSLSGEMGEIKSETIPENLKQKLMKRDNEVRKHVDHHHHYYSHHHPRRKERKYELLFKRTLKKRPPQLSQSEFYDSSSKEEPYQLRKAYSLTSGDSEERLLNCKFTQWEENPEPYKKPNNVGKVVDDEKRIIEERKKSKWLKCKQLLRTDPELDNIVSQVLINSVFKDEKDKELDNEIANVLIEALRFDEEQEAKSEKSSDSTEEQVVPIITSNEEDSSVTTKESEDVKDDSAEEEPRCKSVSIQTAESSLHIATCESFDYCSLCHENIVKEENECKGVKTEQSCILGEINDTQKESMEKIDNLITKNLKSMYKDKLGTQRTIKGQHQRMDLNTRTPQRKVMNSPKSGDKLRSDVTRLRPPHTSPSDKYRRSPRSHSCINLNNNNKQTTPPNRQYTLKSPQSRRSANTLGVKFHQKFEAIPEEKSGSVESSEDQGKSPKPTSSRRSIPADILLIQSEDVVSLEKNKSSDKVESHLEVTTKTSHEQGRRKTVHGNILGVKSIDKHNRRNTVHGSMNLESQTPSGRQLNLNVGSIMRGQVIGQRGNVMIGRFRPLNDDVGKDENEKILIGEIERIERLQRKTYKGKEALEATRSEEQEELMTLSKGWINFYLLRESMELGSDHSYGDEGSQMLGDTIERGHSILEQEDIVEKNDEKVHQYTVQIRASEEPTTDREERFPGVNRSNRTSPLSSCESTDLNLPGISASSPVMSPNSMKSRSPTISEATSVQSEGLPQLLTSKKSILKSCILKQSTSKYSESKKDDRSIISSPTNSEQEYNYLPSPQSEIQLRTPHSECGEISPITPTSSTCDSRSESPVLPSIKWPIRQIQRRQSHRYYRLESGRQRVPLPVPPVSQNNGTCWTVTVAGNSGNPGQPPPDVEMRLSFQPNQQKSDNHNNIIQHQQYVPITSGANVMTPNHKVQDKERRLRRAIQDSTESPQPGWSLTVKNKNEEEEKEERRSHYSKSGKRSAKKGCQYERRDGTEEEKREFAFIWPKVEEILDNGPLKKPSVNNVQWNSSDIQELSVTGLAITPEKKPRVPTMSERDLTRVHYSRMKLY